MKQYAGEEFLNKIYRDLSNSEIVKHSGKGGNKNEDVHAYMERLERITKKGLEHDKLRLLKQAYYNKYVIKPENVPDSYFQQQEKMALDRGYGHVHYTDEIKKMEIEKLISEQQTSLDMWIDYFASPDTEMYPTWFKYFCFQGMVRLGYFDKSTDKFTKRTDSTLKPFIEINREALAMVFDELIKVLNKEKVADSELEQLLKSGSFSKIYAYCIKKLDSVRTTKSSSDEGRWKKYLQGSDPNILFNDIHGKGTGWCTAGGLETATLHLQGGDFYVYYTMDQNNEFTCPRLAIRMSNGKIAEIRGIAEQQNIESNMEKVIEKKLEEFPDKDEYKKKVKDMEMLTYIYTKWSINNSVELSKDELGFLYEMKDEIVSFGYAEDPRIPEILNSRNKKKDLSLLFGIAENQISLTKEEATKPNIVFHYGGLDFSELTDGNGLRLPEIVKGYVDLSNMRSADGSKLPRIVYGTLDMNGLLSAQNVEFPTEVDYLYLQSLTSAEGLKLPNAIRCYLDLSGLKSARSLVLSDGISSVDLSGLTRAKFLELPDEMDFVNLGSLTSGDGLKLPTNVSDAIDLSSLKSTDGMIIPDELNCELYCSLANDDINILKQMCKENNKSK